MLLDSAGSVGSLRSVDSGSGKDDRWICRILFVGRDYSLLGSIGTKPVGCYTEWPTAVLDSSRA